MAILFLHLDNFATSLTVACKARAEWTFSPKLETRNPDRIYRRSGSPPCDGCRGAENHSRCLPARVPQPLLNQAVVVRSGHPSRTELSQAAVPPLRWKIMAGPKVMARGQTCDRVIAWPSDMPVGSYRLHLTDASCVTEETPLMVAPPRAFDGDFDRCWLLAVQLLWHQLGAQLGDRGLYRPRRVA